MRIRLSLVSNFPSEGDTDVGLDKGMGQRSMPV